MMKIFSIPLLLLSASMVFAQSPSAKLSPDQPTAAVEDHGWSAQGELILKIVIYAPTAKTFALGKLSESKSADTVIFSTKESYLQNPATQEKFPALQRIPTQPKFSFGRVKGAFNLEPGEKTSFTGAFPKLPRPLQKPDGKYEDYHLILHLPGGVPPVEFTIPAPNP